MKFKQFRVVAFVGIVVMIVLMRSCMCGHASAPVQQTYAPVAPVQNVAPPAQPVYPQQQYAEAQRPQVPVQPAQLTVEVLRSKVEAWLRQNPDRRGQMQIPDIMPNEPFRATAVRFQDPDARKWSNDSRQWSQIKIDVNRDGIYDEKWLLKNGWTYKRETLNAAGQSTNTEYFQ